MLAKLHCIRFFVKTATRGVVLLLLWRLAVVLTEMLLENYSITTLLKPVYITNTVASNFTYYFVITVSYGLYLVAGFLSDAYWGSYNALVGSLWMLWLGAVWGSGGLTGAVYLESRGLKLAVRSEHNYYNTANYNYYVCICCWTDISVLPRGSRRQGALRLTKS